MKMHLITQGEFDKFKNWILEENAFLKSQLSLLVKAQTDDSKVFTKEEASKYIGLTINGLNTARRERRITGTKLNSKEFGYKKSDLDKYLSRYKKHPQT